MVTNNFIKWVQSLRQKKYRLQNGLFIAEGPRIINELTFSDYKIHSILATADGLTNLHEALYHQATAVSPQQLKKMSLLDNPQEVLALVQMPEPKKFEEQAATDWVLVVDGLQNPGNLGTIIRTADWFGISQVVCSTDTVDAYNPKVVQGTMGSLFHLAVYYEDLTTFLSNCNCPVFTLEMEGQDLFDYDLPMRGILVTGNEAGGIREDLKPYITQSLTIPRFGKAESLNAGIATAIGLSRIRYKQKKAGQ